MFGFVRFYIRRRKGVLEDCGFIRVFGYWGRLEMISLGEA